MEIWHYWIIAALLLFIVEIMTSGFAIACLSVGCLLASIASAFELTLAWQIGFFALGSFMAFIFIRPLVLKLMNKNSNNNITTNTDNLIGRKAVVTEKIENDGFGRVKIDGDDWKARMEDDSEAEVGEKVTIVSQESVILTVKK